VYRCRSCKLLGGRYFCWIFDMQDCCMCAVHQLDDNTNIHSRNWCHEKQFLSGKQLTVAVFLMVAFSGLLLVSSHLHCGEPRPDQSHATVQLIVANDSLMRDWINRWRCWLQRGMLTSHVAVSSSYNYTIDTEQGKCSYLQGQSQDLAFHDMDRKIVLKDSLRPRPSTNITETD